MPKCPACGFWKLNEFSIGSLYCKKCNYKFKGNEDLEDEIKEKNGYEKG